jgi:hypothetical protein
MREYVECRAHRMRRVAAIEPERVGIFPDHAVDRVRVHASPLLLALAVVLERPEQGPVDVGAVPRGLQIGVTTRKCSERTTSGTLSELRPPV